MKPSANVPSVCLGFALLGLGLFAVPVAAQMTQTASVMNGFGGRATGGGYRQISAGAQPGGVATAYENGTANYAGGMINRAGFINTFILFPDLDTNNNGLPNELDPDNDGDGLWDHWEISGEKFSPATPTDPNAPDSGNTGVSDYEAMVAGTDPYDPDAVFRIIDLAADGTDAEVTWRARGNHERIYVVRVIDDSYDDTPSTVIWSNTVAGGSAPWYTTEATITNETVGARFFAVEVMNP
jgi:hypothetical protein